MPGSAPADRRILPPAGPHPGLCRPGHQYAGPDIRILALAYPEFTFSEPVPGRNGPTWTVIRKDPSQPGLYAAVTPDLGELRDILADHASQQPDGSNSGT